jgi:ACR3 family arsenite efflux pump ArsB
MRRSTSWLTAGATAWAAALLVAAFVAPVYSSDAVDGTGAETHGTDTLVGANGTGIALVVAAPLLAAVLGWVAIRHGQRAAAWAIVAVLVAFCLVSVLSIGVFVAPVALLLGLAARRA